ncbi:MAG: hypothetical protein KG003_12915 [Bacteroidetes bacterium]|nr:hypothetical protein [Bacteroidota bacterium]
MLELSKTKQGFFSEDKSRFDEFDTDFRDPFAENWLTAIAECEAELQDVSIVSQMTNLTEGVAEKMEQCRTAYQELKFFVEKAFPNNKPVWNEFGYAKYDSARQSQAQMVQFMQEAHTVARKYKDQLTAKNYPEGKIELLLTLKQELDAANTQQEMFKGGRPTLTQTRITKLNTAWEITVKVCRAGKIIFIDDKAKYDRYALPAGAGGDEEEEPENPAPPPPTP